MIIRERKITKILIYKTLTILMMWVKVTFCVNCGLFCLIMAKPAHSILNSEITVMEQESWHLLLLPALFLHYSVQTVVCLPSYHILSTTSYACKKICQIGNKSYDNKTNLWMWWENLGKVILNLTCKVCALPTYCIVNGTPNACQSLCLIKCYCSLSLSFSLHLFVLLFEW